MRGKKVKTKYGEYFHSPWSENMRKQIQHEI